MTVCKGSTPEIVAYSWRPAGMPTEAAIRSDAWFTPALGHKRPLDGDEITGQQETKEHNCCESDSDMDMAAFGQCGPAIDSQC